ncbi:hypothetical protein [Candidatus Rhabdochlamydia sp. T3358]|uniref:hypothetical protein n=1 Tax=Candidatus Rhabdochlamydia sp. T3358 TaxID=2099795 RepID=UPI0010B1128B|nr:hypothetical protein [Candidatus Rhabdochlamydia sp. T3358]VHO02053.1 hypothetical protein RHT_00372 [Candidatus Rhabdochlamydia sp. T3358]
MTGLDETYLRNMKRSEVLKQEFLRCDSKEDISEKQNMVQETFLKASIGANEPMYVNQPIYETIDGLIIQALYSEPLDNKESVYSEPVGANEPTYANESIYETIDEEACIQALYSEPLDNKESVYSEPVGANEPIYETLRFQKSDVTESQQKTELVISNKSLLKIEGKFKKKDNKNLQNIVDWSQSSDTNNFDIYFKLILKDLKKLKSSSSKLAAFLYILDSTKDLNQIDSKKLYKTLPRKYKKLIKKSNPKFSVNMRSPESLKSIDSIRAHLKERSIFIKAEPFPLKNRI